MIVSEYMIETKYYMKEIEETDRYTAYGNFLDRFIGLDHKKGGKRIQEYLIKEKPLNCKRFPIDMAVISASVEVLAKERNISIPAWVYDSDCYLKKGYYAGATTPEYRKFLKDTAISEFKKRNLFLGDNCMSRA